MIYTLYKANGDTQHIEEIKPMKLERMQELVGGYIEFTPVAGKKDLTFCVNEEGRLMHLPINQTFPQYVGDILLGRLDENGDFVGVS